MISILHRLARTALAAALLASLLAVPNHAVTASTYALVSPGSVKVARGSFNVVAQQPWSRVGTNSNSGVHDETWTRNGPLLDTVAFTGALGAGQTLVRPVRGKERGDVLPFDPAMDTAQKVEMLASHYRVAGAQSWQVAGTDETSFLGGPALRVEFAYVGRDALPRRAVAVMAVRNDRLYLMKLEAEASHYFDRLLAEFEAMVATAALPD